VFIRGQFEKAKPKQAFGRKHEMRNPKQRHFGANDLKKQSQLIVVQCSAFSGQRQDQEKAI
jgi:hypothetical protein